MTNNFDPSTIAKIIFAVVFLFFFIRFLILADRYLRVKILLLFTPWHAVKSYEPGPEIQYSGVYIWQKKGHFFWKTVYVGQSVNVAKRFRQHITGKGSTNIYQDYKRNPNKLRFKSISLQKVHYKNLDALEKRLIDHYHTFDRGYNKTRGNGHKHY